MKNKASNKIIIPIHSVNHLGCICLLCSYLGIYPFLINITTGIFYLQIIFSAAVLFFACIIFLLCLVIEKDKLKEVREAINTKNSNFFTKTFYFLQIIGTVILAFACGYNVSGIIYILVNILGVALLWLIREVLKEKD